MPMLRHQIAKGKASLHALFTVSSSKSGKTKSFLIFRNCANVISSRLIPLSFSGTLPVNIFRALLSLAFATPKRMPTHSRIFLNTGPGRRMCFMMSTLCLDWLSAHQLIVCWHFSISACTTWSGGMLAGGCLGPVRRSEARPARGGGEDAAGDVCLLEPPGPCLLGDDAPLFPAPGDDCLLEPPGDGCLLPGDDCLLEAPCLGVAAGRSVD
mmetsp:Transcript_10964/g.19180  ORF Transcript_10964/g.19180 Transcript_10964/m.19180 type:complete len:211 (-) Transcript_10964:129-761(-)